MPQALRKVQKWKLWNMPVSYNILDQKRMADCSNACTIQKILQTRPGTSRWNATAISADEIMSLSFFTNNADADFVISKSGASIFKVPATGASTALKAGLTSTTKHRAVTFNGRHFLAVESDGLYSYDGTTFSQLGQVPPATGSEALSSGGSLTDTNTYQVGLTFYDSTNGFETNIFGLDQSVTASPNLQIDVSNIPATATNGNIDKVRIYLKDVTAAGDYLFFAEINLGTTTYTVDSVPTSTSTPPTKNAPPLAGGAKYLTMFGDRLVYSGNSNFPSDVFFSEIYIPDAWDDTSSRVVLTGAGNGPITGLATGFYGSDNMDPYLCIFKRNSVEVYSELGGIKRQSLISPNIGAPSQDTVQVINGDVHFMSTKGWHVISNGNLIKKDRRVYNLGDGDVDNIFNDDGFTYALNKSEMSNFKSIYYPTLDQYITFIKESGSTNSFKAYNFEFNINGFRTYAFPLNIIDVAMGEDSAGETTAFFATEGGFVMKHNIGEAKSDTLSDNTTQAISVFGNFYWISGDDMDATFNFGEFIARALRNDNLIQFNYYLDYKYDIQTNEDFDFTEGATGFTLDVSKLDEGILSDGRNVVRHVGSIYKTSQSLLITFNHEVSGSNINFIEAQLDFSKNGNPNA